MGLQFCGAPSTPAAGHERRRPHVQVPSLLLLQGLRAQRTACQKMPNAPLRPHPFIDQLSSQQGFHQASCVSYCGSTMRQDTLSSTVTMRL